MSIIYYAKSDSDAADGYRYLCRNWDFVIPDTTAGAIDDYIVTEDASPASGKIYATFDEETGNYYVVNEEMSSGVYNNQFSFIPYSEESGVQISPCYFYKSNGSNVYIDSASYGDHPASDRIYYTANYSGATTVNQVNISSNAFEFDPNIIYYEPISTSTESPLTYEVDFNTAYFLTEDFWTAVKNANDGTGDFESVLALVAANNEPLDASSKLTMSATMSETITITPSDTISVSGGTSASGSGYEGNIYKITSEEILAYDASGNRIDSGFRKYTLVGGDGIMSTALVPPEQD